ncbi:carboxylesterase/lipase family protein [Actinopolymorpha pittospori]|uniref:Carboxylic ester hydrolase n=1 Tax=Actinopolymorpha pittospori TaxID=648752 RepID=A0A927RQF4_9ACTN|nr:carboxylesterase family protein [Actinopolymorpha pittospori]MBE1613051.1 para-nitrobenzyl esterase [Actinopolymorpha pittospori]
MTRFHVLRRVTTLAATILAIPLLAGAGTPPASASAPPDADNVVRTRAGPVEGVRGEQTTRFLGIPYAAPPVGHLRWRPPQPVRPWLGVRPAKKSGPPCAQSPGSITPGTDSEDCLYVDVTVPRDTTNTTETADTADTARGRRPLPVMVWLHGGGLSSGAGSGYDPTRMVSQGDVIVVTVDFRLGIFRFFGHPGLPGSGTFGLADQQAALRFVRTNIAAFGGDPHNVTLFGQSGGAVGACGQLTSPSAAGLFDKVVLMSGSCTLDWPKNGPAIGTAAGSFWTPVGEANAAGARTASELDCARDTDAAELRCLRGLDKDDLLTRNGAFIAAATGTPILPLDPGVAIRAGHFHHVPAISGHTRDEARLIAGSRAFLGQPITAAEYPGLIEEAYGDDAAAVDRHYPRGDQIPGIAWASIDTDRMFVCTQLETSRALSRRVPTYTYEFADEHAPPLAPVAADFPAGASHAADLLYLFDIPGLPIDDHFQPVEYTPEQRALAATMVGYWTRFAWTSDPNGGGRPVWHRDEPAGTGELGLAPGVGGISTVDAAREHQCDFWRDRL